MALVDEWTVRGLILAFLWLEFLWNFYLSIRQYKVVVGAKEVPNEIKKVLTVDTFEKSRDYSKAKMKFGFVKDIYDIILSTAVIHFDVLSYLWDYSLGLKPNGGEVLTSCIWFFLLTTLMMFLSLPFSVYSTFVLEEQFGFNKQTPGFFVWDKIKTFILSQVLTLMISSIVIVIIKNGGHYFFIWLWATVCLISLILMTIYPAVIAPLFDKYTPLPEGALRTEIEKLATQLEFPLTEIFIVEGSKRSAHSNAYFYGLFKSKRIVLYDTLLEKEDNNKGCTNEEILAVLSHELGHWSCNHIVKNLVVIQFNLFLLFMVFSYMFKSPLIYKSIGFYKSQPVLVGLYVVLTYIMTPYNALLSFLTTCLSRRFEFEADNFAVQLKKGEPLQRALLQLYKDNLSFPIYDNLYSAYNHSHPPLLERMAAISRESEKSK